MSELKPGMQGTSQGTWGGAPVEIIHVGEQRLFVRSVRSGDEYMIYPESFIPDPTPPSTVKVEMSVEDARHWAKEWPDSTALPESPAWNMARDCAAALRAEGLE